MKEKKNTLNIFNSIQFNRTGMKNPPMSVLAPNKIKVSLPFGKIEFVELDWTPERSFWIFVLLVTLSLVMSVTH